MEGSPRLAQSLLNTIGFCIKNLLELLKEIYCLFVYNSLLLCGSVMLNFCFFLKNCVLYLISTLILPVSFFLNPVF